MYGGERGQIARDVQCLRVQSCGSKHFLWVVLLHCWLALSTLGRGTSLPFDWLGQEIVGFLIKVSFHFL